MATVGVFSLRLVRKIQLREQKQIPNVECDAAYSCLLNLHDSAVPFPSVHCIDWPVAMVFSPPNPLSCAKVFRTHMQLMQIDKFFTFHRVQALIALCVFQNPVIRVAEK